jgi:hypothetical protein
MPIALEAALRGYTKRVCATDPQFGALPGLGTDQWAAIQAAIDYALEHHILDVDLPSGRYKISKTLHLGYGVNPQFTSVRLHGAGANYLLDGTATTIEATFVDRPIINVQGGRDSGIDDCHIIGGTPILNPQLHTLAYRADPANYIPSGAKDDPRAPFCGVCIDAYSGIQDGPTVPYPVPTYPAYLGLGTVTNPYGRAFSSGAFVRRCIIEHSHIGIMGSPNADANNDFLDLDGTQINFQKICVALGNSQARNTNFANLNCNFFHTGFDGVSYGVSGIGGFAGHWDNVHANTFYRLFNVALNWSAPILFANFYNEVGMRIGDFGGTGTFMAVGCLFDVSDTDRFNPGDEIYSEPQITGDGGVTFRNCRIDYPRAGFVADCPGARFEQCTLRLASWEEELAGAELDAIKAFGGLFLSLDPSRPDPFPRVLGGQWTYGTLSAFDSDSVQTWHAHGSSYQVVRSYLLPQANRGYSVSITGAARSGRTLTGTAVAAGPFENGDVLYGENGNWFFVTDYDSGTGAITLQAVTGYKWDGVTYTAIDTTIPTNWYYFPKDALIPPVSDKFFRTTSGSPTLEVVDASGAAASVPSGITTASKPFWLGPNLVDYLGRAVPFPALTKVDAVGANSLTMSANALTSGTWAIGPGLVKVK